ncbi:hypothetical protein D3C78_1442990 [compost metagenome]
MEVACTEGLQRMLLSHRRQQLLLLIHKPPTIGQVITQLTDEHRCRALAVVANTASDPTDVELIASREQGFEQQVAVVLTPRTVTGAVVAAHQVKVQRRLRTRVVTVVHAQ